MSYCLNPDCPQPQNPADSQFCQQCGMKLRLRSRYQMIRKIGQGGFGRTFLALDLSQSTGSTCVVKQFFPQDQGIAQVEKAAHLFMLEAVRLSDLGQHPQIPALLAHFEQDGRQYLVQEFIDGQTLADELAQTGPLSDAAIVNLLQQLLPMLDFIHQHQVIHRDIKPENILRRKTTSTTGQNLVLVDFGAAKIATPTDMARTGTMIGSASYAAPEQTWGKAVFASDLYSLGVTCIHLMTGIEPFDLFSFSDDAWVWRDYLNRSVDERLGAVLDRMMARSLKQRYLSAAEALQDLMTITPSASTPLTVASPPSAAPTIELIDDLTSSVGADFHLLQTLLATAQWIEADAETTRIMLQVAGQPNDGQLSFAALESFPCVDLNTINRLWLKYSQEHFGFSIQAKIWDSVQRPGVFPIEVWNQFCEQLGWLTRQHNSLSRFVTGEDHEYDWRSRDEIWGLIQGLSRDEIHEKIPQGCLPSFRTLYPGSSRGGKIFLERIKTCEI